MMDFPAANTCDSSATAAKPRPHHVTLISTSDWLSAITCRRRGAGRAAAVATATGGGGGQVGRAAPVSLCCRAPSGLRFGSGGAG